MPSDAPKTDHPAEFKGAKWQGKLPAGRNYRSVSKGQHSTSGLSNMRDSPAASQLELMKFEPRHVPGALRLSQEMAWPYRREDWEVAAALGQGLVLERRAT